ncbi:DoxX family protein [Hymenobacter tibetensis]|uniref:DoxX family protein n=1 Tax=Hymenobacter tibetensis TaxID=497967 RepID=A0ABY4CU30_9BACT|nr:DoxX family protein [Hymenobacter tibetensis]UOG73621.1 DoxX family protein [Hymenobacter tibetensis]
MKPLFVLLGAFLLALGATRLFGGSLNFLLAGNVALAVMLLFTGAAHFALTNGMVLMLPEWLPGRKAWVYFTGVVELAAAMGLLVPALRPLVGWLLIAFFVLVLPGNIYAAMHHINYQKATTDGPGPRYLWFRIPLQLLFIAWTWYFSVHLPATLPFASLSY